MKFRNTFVVTMDYWSTNDTLNIFQPREMCWNPWCGQSSWLCENHRTLLLKSCSVLSKAGFNPAETFMKKMRNCENSPVLDSFFGTRLSFPWFGTDFCPAKRNIVVLLIGLHNEKVLSNEYSLAINISIPDIFPCIESTLFLKRNPSSYIVQVSFFYLTAEQLVPGVNLTYNAILLREYSFKNCC